MDASSVQCPAPVKSAQSDVSDDGDGESGADEYVLRQLHERIVARTVIPFLGSGVAAALGYKPWARFLRDAAACHGAALKTLVGGCIQDSEYEVAADLIHSCAAGDFLPSLSEHYCTQTPALLEAAKLYQQPRRLLVDPSVPAAVLLPLIFACGPVVTSAFDPVAMTLFEAAGRPFVREVLAPEGGLIQQLVLHQRLLLRLHGSLAVPQSRVLLSAEHRACFLDDKQVREQLRIDLNKAHSNLLRHLCSARSLLFIGCGLNHDYTLEVLQRVTEFLPDSRHFALLAQSEPPSRALARRLQRYNIEPIFYPEPAQRPQALTRLLQRLARMSAAAEPQPQLGAQASAQPGAQLGAQLGAQPDAQAEAQAAAVAIDEAQPSGATRIQGAPPGRTELRQMIDDWLRSEDDLMAFLHDHFPRVALQIAPRMTRKGKVTVLFTYEDSATIYRKLLQECPQLAAKEPGAHAPQRGPAPPAAPLPSERPVPRCVEVAIPIGAESVDLIKLLRASSEQPDETELEQILGRFGDLLHGDGQHLQLSLASTAITLTAQPPLFTPQSGGREPAVVLPRRPGPASPRLFLYFPRRQIGEGYTLSLEASPTVRLKLVAPGREPAPTLSFVERSAQ